MLRKVGEIAHRIANKNFPFYTEDMVQLIPKCILDRELTDENLIKTSEEIDEIRFGKEKMLSEMLGIATSDPSLQELEDVINNKERFNSLTTEQQRKVKEIKFLFNVAATVAHQ